MPDEEKEAPTKAKKAAVKKEKEAPTKMSDLEKARRLVACFVSQRSAFNVRGDKFIEVFTNLRIEKSYITYYRLGQSHVMPAGHAGDLISAGVVTRDSVRLFPKSLQATKKPTGIVCKQGETKPIAIEDKPSASDFENSGQFDIDNIPEIEDGAEDWTE